MSNEKDKKRVRELLLTHREHTILVTALDDLITTIRQEERTSERKRVLDAIKRVPATAAGADAFRKRLIEELYVEAAANETRKDETNGSTNES